MVKVEVAGGSLYLDGILKANLDFISRDVRKDSDAVIVVDGRERSGKSVFAMQIGAYLDPSLNLERVCFNPEEFRSSCLAAGQYQVCIFDEAISGMRAARWSSEVSQMLVELLGVIGQKNLIIILVIPSFFELIKYAAIHRSVGLLHVHKLDGQRGYFKLYDYNRKKNLYLLGKKTFNYACQKPNARGRFTGAYVLDEAAYRVKKSAALTSDTCKPKDTMYKGQRDALIAWLVNEKRVNAADIAFGMKLYSGRGLSRRQVSDIGKKAVAGGDNYIKLTNDHVSVEKGEGAVQ